MPLRPIDALFVDFDRRQYVVYYRGELWQLPRMKINDASWQRRQPYDGVQSKLYLSRLQAIEDPVLAQKLRTLNLPEAVRGSTLPRFEAWWDAHGFDWLKTMLIAKQSPLASQTEGDNDTDNSLTQATANSSASNSAATINNKVNAQTEKSFDHKNTLSTNTNPSPKTADKRVTAAEKADIFAAMLAELADEVLNQTR